MAYLNKQKINKNLKYFLTEIIIVILGIFLAVQLNNWNENKNKKTEEKKSLKLLINDLKMEKFIMNYSKNSMSNYVEKLTKISEGELDNVRLDSIVLYLDNEYVHQKINSAYLNMKNGGKLNTINNDSLKNQIVSFYESQYSAFEALSNSHTSFIYNNLRPYILRELPFDLHQMVDKSVVKEKLKDPILMNLINYQIARFNQINVYLKPNNLDLLIKNIEKEL